MMLFAALNAAPEFVHSTIANSRRSKNSGRFHVRQSIVAGTLLRYSCRLR